MREIAFIRGDWLELAAANYPQRVLVYSYTVQVPDFPDANQGRVSVLFRQTETNRVLRRKSA